MTLNLDAGPRFVRFGRFTFDRENSAITRDDLPLELTGASGALLSGLLERANTVVAYHQLAGVEEPMQSAPAAMRTAMKELRQLLRDPVDYPMFIETIRGVGYRFVAPLRDADDLTHARALDDGETLPSPNLVRWCADDEASVGFAVVWLIAATTLGMPIAGWLTVPLALIPAGIRLGFRLLTFHGLQRDGVSASELRRALAWADEQQQSTALRGWRAAVQRAATLSAAGATVVVLAMDLAIRFEPWTWSTALQGTAQVALSVAAGVVATTVGLIIADAVVNPQPLLQRIRKRACRFWRALLAGTLPAASIEDDAYRLAGQREVQELLSAPGTL